MKHLTQCTLAVVAALALTLGATTAAQAAGSFPFTTGLNTSRRNCWTNSPPSTMWKS